MLVALELEGLPVVVFGQTEEITRRAHDLVKAGALVTVVSPEYSRAISELVANLPEVVVSVKEPSPTDLDGKWLAVVADRNPAWVSLLGPAARERRVAFCAIDQPGHNTFSHVGMARAGALTLGISTSGRAPGLAGKLTKEFQDLLDRSQFKTVVDQVVLLREQSTREERSARVREFVKGVRIVGTIVSPGSDSHPDEED
jgi:precorrin-2 dehydrogenase / sirohydrochlorin ferrochelatase